MNKTENTCDIRSLVHRDANGIAVDNGHTTSRQVLVIAIIYNRVIKTIKLENNEIMKDFK